jgi:hypothetical protein
MIKKVLKITQLENNTGQKEDNAYWLNKTPEERIEAVELLRKQYHGTLPRLQRVARVIQQT